MDLSGDVLEFLAAQVQHNIRVLEGSLNRVVAYTPNSSAPPSPRNWPPRPSRTSAAAPAAPMLTAGRIIDAVARAAARTVRSIGRNRDKETASARPRGHVPAAAAPTLTLNQIGQELSSAMPPSTNSCRKVAGDIGVEPLSATETKRPSTSTRPGLALRLLISPATIGTLLYPLCVCFVISAPPPAPQDSR